MLACGVMRAAEVRGLAAAWLRHAAGGWKRWCRCHAALPAAAPCASYQEGRLAPVHHIHLWEPVRSAPAPRLASCLHSSPRPAPLHHIHPTEQCTAPLSCLHSSPLLPPDLPYCTICTSLSQRALPPASLPPTEPHCPAGPQQHMGTQSVALLPPPPLSLNCLSPLSRPAGPQQRMGTKSLVWMVGMMDALEEAELLQQGQPTTDLIFDLELLPTRRSRR